MAVLLSGGVDSSLALQLLCALTIILIVALQLSELPSGDPGGTQVSGQCLLGTDAQGNSLCVYAYIVAGASMALSLLLGGLTVRLRGVYTRFNSTPATIPEPKFALCVFR